MKRTLLVLASLMAIALLSCSDNSNSLTEDLNLPQSQALPNGLSAGELTPIKGNNSFLAKKAEAASSAEEYSTYNVSCGSMSVSGVSHNNWAQSSKATCNFTGLPTGSINLAYEIFFGSYYNVNGTFSIYNLIIECGNNSGYYDGYIYNWYGDLYSVGTYAFQGDPAKVTCQVSFYGKCNGTGLGGTPCSFGINGVNMTSYYL
ncbi:MAG: hypothetical protein LBU89_13440 [Fibromonadaceae bacterium]|jgi:hypothetical protein|nr:hypothetical protein [Fibromonadaceae bacterium]